MFTNPMFYLCIFILASIPLILIIISDAKIFKKIFYSIIILGISSFVAANLYNCANKNSAEWNDGYCTKCGKPWRFVNGSISKCETVYFWICDDCSIIIKLHSNYEKK